MDRHIIFLKMENKFGTLARIAGLFSGRGYNIDSLSVNCTDENDTSIMTIVTRGDKPTLEQIIKQLRKLINVLQVRDVTRLEHLEQELVLVKLKFTKGHRAEILGCLDAFEAKPLEIGAGSIIVRFAGNGKQIAEFLAMMGQFEVIELVRSGHVALNCGGKSAVKG